MLGVLVLAAIFSTAFALRGEKKCVVQSAAANRLFACNVHTLAVLQQKPLVLLSSDSGGTIYYNWLIADLGAAGYIVEILDQLENNTRNKCPQ